MFEHLKYIHIDINKPQVSEKGYRCLIEASNSAKEAK